MQEAYRGLWRQGIELMGQEEGGVGHAVDLEGTVDMEPKIERIRRIGEYVRSMSGQKVLKVQRTRRRKRIQETERGCLFGSGLGRHVTWRHQTQTRHNKERTLAVRSLLQPM
ncbi:hypothetical protein J31TS4_09560 [Paenibacillus sp. J31TS4]|nr:hypothetical protein J31TS4_09560 [Paenibacillus sp. J31TS4]